MKQVTAILLGAGQRGAEAYASYALDYPNELKFVAVAEPRADRREEFAKLHDIAPQNAVESDMELFEPSEKCGLCSDLYTGSDAL